MNRPARLLLAHLICLIALVPARAGAEETILTFDWSTRTMAYRAQASAPTLMDSTRTEVTLCLGDDYFKFYDAQGIWFYDFERRRVLRVDPRARTYNDWSLYAYVAYNHLELARRSGTSGPRRAARPGVSIRELEALFGMASTEIKPDPREALIDSSSSDEARVLINGRLSVSATPSTHALSPARARMFELFLLHRAHLHPSSRKAIMRLNHVPQALYWRSQDFQQETRVLLELKGVTTAPENTNPVAGCRRVDIGDPTFAVLEKRLGESRGRCSDSAQAAGIQASMAFETQSLAAGHYLEAHLARAERSLLDCGPAAPEAWPAAVRRRAQADTLLQTYLAASQWTDAAGAENSFQKLPASAPDSLQMGYMIEFDGARARQAMGDFDGSVSLTLSALESSPCAIDGWIDLYRSYLGTHQTVLAWMCLDHVRSITKPDCASLADGARFEQELLARHPEFFR